MEDLLLEEKMDRLSKPDVNEFVARFVEPILISIEDKIQFETLFDRLQLYNIAENRPGEEICY